MRIRLFFMTLLFVVLSPLVLNSSVWAAEGSSGGGPTMSWRDIFARKDLFPEFPSYGAEGINLPVYEFCDAGDEFHSYDPVEKCKRYGTNERSACEQEGWEDLVVSAFKRHYRCERWENNRRNFCLEWNEWYTEKPKVHRIPVYRKKEGFFERKKLFFHKDFKVEPCP